MQYKDLSKEEKEEFSKRAKELGKLIVEVTDKAKSLGSDFEMPTALLLQVNVGPYLGSGVAGAAEHIKLIIAMIIKKIAELEAGAVEPNDDPNELRNVSDCDSCPMKPMCDSADEDEDAPDHKCSLN